MLLENQICGPHLCHSAHLQRRHESENIVFSVHYILDHLLHIWRYNVRLQQMLGMNSCWEWMAERWKASSLALRTLEWLTLQTVGSIWKQRLLDLLCKFVSTTVILLCYISSPSPTPQPASTNVLPQRQLLGFPSRTEPWAIVPIHSSLDSRDSSVWKERHGHSSFKAN